MVTFASVWIKEEQKGFSFQLKESTFFIYIKFNFTVRILDNTASTNYARNS